MSASNYLVCGGGSTRLVLRQTYVRLWLRADPHSGRDRLVVLDADHRRVAATGHHKLVVSAELGDAALVEDGDLVGVADGREPVCDREGRATARRARRARACTARSVSGSSALVASSRIRTGGSRRIGARDRDALLLAAREAVAALADDRLVAIGQARRSGRGSARRAPRARARPGSRPALRSAGCRRSRRGRDMSPARRRRRSPQRRVAEVAHVDAVDRHPSLARPRRGGRADRRAWSCRSPSRRRPRGWCPARHLHVDVAQGPLAVGGVAEADLARTRPSPRTPAGRADGAIALLDLNRQSRYSKTRSNSASELCTSTPTESSDWIGEEEPRLQRGERDQGADRDRLRRRLRSRSPRPGRSAPASRRRRSAPTPSASARPCASGPRGPPGQPTRARSARPARPSGPSSCPAGSPRPTAIPRPAPRCRPADPGAPP